MSRANEKHTVRGVVQKTSEKGVVVDGKFYVYGRYFRGDEPQRGDFVILDCWGDFINSCEVQGATEKENDDEEVPDRDTRIMRQALLNTSVAILTATRKDFDECEVTSMAARLEQYVLSGIPLQEPAGQKAEKSEHVERDQTISQPSKSSGDGHAHHGEVVADARVRRLMKNKACFGATNEEELKSAVAELLGVDSIECLHATVMELSNWSTINKYISASMQS
jgi:hypothetical protein